MIEGGGSADHAFSKRWAFADPDGFQRLIDLLSDAIAAYLEHQIEAGAEAVQIFDSWAGALPEFAFRRWCIEPVAAIVGRLKARYPAVPVIAFPRGAGSFYAGFAKATGVDAISLDSNVPLQWAAAALQSDSCVQGNLDPQLLVVGGAPMHREAERILATLGKGPFVFNLGHGIVQATPPEHVGELVAQVRNWRG
jgi:uroporphyrinogen decarboxylase